MSMDPVVETVYGSLHKYEIIKKVRMLGMSVQFYIRRDGKPHRGPYNSLRSAVEAAMKEGGVR